MTGQRERENLLVDLVDRQGRPIGVTTVEAAHTSPGLLHSAFSIFLLTQDKKKMLMQQRSSSKLRWPLYWANACCGHTQSNLSLLDSAYLRLKEELGITSCELFIIGPVIYRAEYSNKYSEYEYDYVLVGYIDENDDLAFNPDECQEVQFVPLDMSAEKTPIVPWFNPCMNLINEYVDKIKGRYAI